jgi:serine protease AprX
MRGAVLLCALLGVAAAAALSGGAASATDSTSLRTVTVDEVLADRLAANPAGGVTAIVTTWNREGLDDVTSLGVTGTKLRVLPMVISAGLTQAKLDALRQSPAVRSVWGERKYRSSMEDTTWITKARYVWSTNNGPGGLQGFGVTGSGIELAVIDTGIDGKHEDADNLIEFCDSHAGNVPADPTLVDCTPWNPTFNVAPAGLCGAVGGPSNQGPPGPCQNKARGDSHDDEGHGSHVSGTVAGTGHASGGTQNTHSTIGMSPHGRLRVYSANIGPSLLNWQTLAAYDDLIAKREAGYNQVVAVNNSWGGGDGANYEASDPTHVAIKRAWDAGILSVFAAGNSGPEYNTLSAQCVDPYVACIAASTKPDQKVMFSSVGRPSQLMDTNRDGIADADDVQPDNHDWRLGQSLELGRYRPSITAPGVNINSISANSPGCREDDIILPATELPKSGCYEPLNGTSMATPHVTGAAGLIAQAFRSTHGRLPRPNETLDILERSSNTSKLPAWEAEEQGTGRLDVHEAVKFARTYPQGLARPNLGYATPPYQQNAYPNGSASLSASESEDGCTGPVSWSAPNADVLDPVGQPFPAPAPTYGQHFIDVPAKADRLQITVRWGLQDEHPEHESANLYVRVWRPGVDPDAETQPAGQTRVFPDQEALGLLDAPIDKRYLDVRSPEEFDAAETTPGLPATLPQGRWIIRVYHRIGGSPSACEATSGEQPKQAAGYNYRLETVITRVTHRPTVTIDQPAPNAQTTGRWVDIRGRAGYPPPDAPAPGTVGYSWEGVTNWEVPGSASSLTDEHGEPDPNNPRPVLYMHGKPDPHPTTDGLTCTGNGEADVAACDGPFLMEKDTLGAGAPAFWRSGLDDEVFDGTSDRSIHDPNWSWCLNPGEGCPADPSYVFPGSQTVGGPMTVEWWAACNLCTADLGISADWMIRVWADGILQAEERVTATPATAGVPSRLIETIVLPTFTATQRIVVHIDPVYVDSQTVTFTYYDSDTDPDTTCTATGGRCDSLVRMPAGGTGGSAGGAPGNPQNVRVTDLPANSPYPSAPQTPALRVAWDSAQEATSYDVYRSTNPASVGTRVFRGAGTACTSPEAPAPDPADIWPGHDRSGRCFTDTGVQLRNTYYYRVYATQSGRRSNASEIAYGTPTRYDRQVKVKLDRLYGPQYWEYALLSPSPNPTLDIAGTQWRHLWDTLELVPGPHNLFARSFTQGIGSTKAKRTVRDDGVNPPPPPPNGGCPDDDNGDRIDDHKDGDHDDDGDDDDDDCEDDDDHEEDEDD